MSRPLLPSAALAVLAVVGHVRPSFTEDSPTLTEARLVARAGKPLPQPANRCTCRNSECRV